MKCWFLWYEFSENIYSLCKIYKYWQQIAEQQIVTAYLCQHVYRYQKITLKEPFAFQIKNLREASLLSCPENPITPF
jgi:hypothetical protein